MLQNESDRVEITIRELEKAFDTASIPETPSFKDRITGIYKILAQKAFSLPNTRATQVIANKDNMLIDSNSRAIRKNMKYIQGIAIIDPNSELPFSGFDVTEEMAEILTKKREIEQIKTTRIDAGEIEGTEPTVVFNGWFKIS